MKFLIAEDSPAKRTLLRAGLESEGHQVVEAANGVEAVAVLEREPVDAVITDILMPSMDGFRLCAEIRKSTRSYRDVPVVIYTAAYDSLSDRALAEAAGADGYILKPASAAVLIDTVQETLRNACARSNRKTGGGDEAYVLDHYNAALVRQLETQVEQRTAALAAANKEIESFSFTISHDLRAPLRRIGGFAQLLEETASSAVDVEGREFLRQILDGVVQMDQLIDALLKFSRTARTEPNIGEVDLETLLDETLVLLHADLQGRHIEWRRGPLPPVRGDLTLLRTVFVNLLSNAIKYTRPREPALIDIGAEERPRDIVIFVRDNGVGFEMRYAERLFGVFQRMHRADEFEGTGIGLATAQRIVTRHGGSMWAEAEAGRGATFFFSLPRA